MYQGGKGREVYKKQSESLGLNEEGQKVAIAHTSVKPHKYISDKQLRTDELLEQNEKLKTNIQNSVRVLNMLINEIPKTIGEPKLDLILEDIIKAKEALK